MLLVIACALLVVGLTWALIRTTRPKMKVFVETRIHEEEDPSGQRVKVSSVSASYDPIEHQLEVEEWKDDLKILGFIVAIVVVVAIGIAAYNRIS